MDFDLLQFLERFGLPTTMLVLAVYAVFVRQWVVPGWYLQEERQRFKDAAETHKTDIKRANERADRMEQALLKALGAGEVIAEVIRRRADE